MTSGGKWSFSRLMMPRLRASLTLIFFICSFQSSFESIVSPTKLKDYSSSSSTPFIDKFKLTGWRVRLKTTYFVLEAFRRSLLALSQVSTLLSS